MLQRPSKDRYYLEIAKTVALRSPCTRRQLGAIVVVDDTIVSTGYNGPARGVNNCELGCLKDKKNESTYVGYNWCHAVHAEENAVVNAARNGNKVLGGTMFILGTRPATGEIAESWPCDRCSRIIINAGIIRVVTLDKEGNVKEFDPKAWVERDNKWYADNMKSE
ncbi:MAG TPA: dCMP deaminase family protein [archaeon]|nr:dCMP deaminase family protein [archaeon]